jgi:hypothetical protein
MILARKAQSAGANRDEGIPRVTQWLRQEKRQFHFRTVEKVVTWSGNAAPAEALAPQITRVWQALHDDWLQKTELISTLEREMAEILVKTPYLLLLSYPGINVVSASDLAAEMGPIEHYAHSRAITGRAGIFPSRYQSDAVDRADGPLARHRNSRLRAACLGVADNLIKCNAHFHAKFEFWKARGVDPRDIRCRVANRALRGVFQIVSGRRLYHHPSRLDREYVLDKLFAFHLAHATPPHEILRDLKLAADQIPQHEQAAEALPLKERCRKYRRGKRQSSQQLATLLVAVLARYGITGLESTTEAQGPTAEESVTST